MESLFDAYVLLQILNGNRGNEGNSGNLRYIKTMLVEDKHWHSISNMFFMDKKLKRCFKIPFKTSKRDSTMALVHDMSQKLVKCEECTQAEYKMLGY